MTIYRDGQLRTPAQDFWAEVSEQLRAAAQAASAAFQQFCEAMKRVVQDKFMLQRVRPRQRMWPEVRPRTLHLALQANARAPHRPQDRRPARTAATRRR
ncbi:hypothetical protein [Deinococcus multiflagellatus]|uniref:Uncharacterized protein n=1 Tax=Deinococcus multiflagellatus TaxID=1656887 RepID=A0ABW1ZHX1_9DEIO|nr:hypothetical protein [Deinococcus multiflagellatus]MBZ9712204.1 hypothetical protein [Deinococcus multiflagellatus]